MMKTKNIFILLVCSLITAHMHANVLIITRGPVCSGTGSYLANAIKSLDNSYYTISQNDIFNTVSHQLFNVIFPQHMEIINNAIEQENITSAITNYHIYFKETAYEQQKEQAITAIEYIRAVLNDPTNANFLAAISLVKNHAEMTELAYHAACEHNVVWEKRTYSDWDYETAQVEGLFSNILNVVTYCPPTTMIEQWLERNTQAATSQKASHRRLVKQVLTSFFTIFQPADEYQEAVVMLTRDEFDRIIAQAANYILTLPREEFGEHRAFTSSEFTLE